VQCPLCCEEYYLSDALIQLPPMLRVVGSQAAAEKDADYRLAEPVAAAIREPGFGAMGEGGAAVAPRPQLRTVARPRRPEKSAVGEIVKVVLGGAAGLAGGLLVLWWGFGVDVGQLGPKLSKVEYLRYLVPQKLWDQSVRSDKNSAQVEPAGQSRQAKGNGKPKSANGQAASGPAEEVATDSSDSNTEVTTKKGDPFLTLDDLGVGAAPAPAGEDAIGPLAAPPLDVTDQKIRPAETGDESPTKAPPKESNPGDDNAPALKEKAAEEKNPEEKPAKDESDAEKKGADDEANPE
jgi:hypothetical protein